MLHKSWAEAEAAALRGISPSPDSQACAAIFRASVGCDFNQKGDDCSTSINILAAPHALLNAPSLSSLSATSTSPHARRSLYSSVLGVLNPDVATVDHLQADSAISGPLASTKDITTQDSLPHWEPLNDILRAATTTLRRDRNGRLRLVSVDEQVEVKPARRRMEDFGSPLNDSYGSNLSATQENDPSVYARFKINNGVGIRPASPSSDMVGNSQTQDPAVHTQLATTGSGTEISYTPHDTGHLTLDYQPLPSIPFPDLADDTAAHAMPIIRPRFNQLDLDLSDPQTPGQSRLFVGGPGSVLRPSQMFAETQPSPDSRSRHMVLPSSIRPSPDLFPQSHLSKDLASSPLVRRAANMYSKNATTSVSSSPEHFGREMDVSKLDHERPHFSNRSDLLLNGDAESHTAKSLLFQNLPQPFDVYKSRKESQDHRRLVSTSTNVFPSSDDGFSDDEMERNARAQSKRGKAAEQLSTMIISRTGSSGSEIVEVPSTSSGRRRSLAEDYEEQCSGFDARDTQQNDTITDSQSAITAPNVSLLDNANEVLGESTENDSFPVKILSRNSNSPDKPGQSKSTEQLPPLKDQRVSHDDHTSQDSLISQTRRSITQPLCEFSSNIAELRTPAIHRKTDIVDGDAMVPETSPTVPHLQRYGTIVSQSSVLSSPGAIEAHNPFSQDMEYNKMFHSPSPQQQTTVRTVDLSRISHKVTVEASLTAAIEQKAVDVHQSMEDHSVGGNLSKANSTALSAADYDTALTYLPGDHFAEEVKSRSNTSGFRVRENSNDEIMIEDYSMDAMTSKKAPPSGSIVTQKSKNASTGKCRTSIETILNENRPKSNSTTPRTVADIVAVPSASKLQPTLQKPLSPKKSKMHKEQREQNVQINTNSSFVVGTGASDTPELPPKLRSTIQLRRSSRLHGRTDEDSYETPNVISPTRVALVSTKRNSRPPRRASTDWTDNEESFDLEFSASPHPSKFRRSSTARLEKVGLFHNMAFSVTYPMERDAEREDVVNLILQHGGRVLLKGFDELFEPMPFQSTWSTRSAAGENNTEDSSLNLTARARGTGFACLIADRHSRRVKFMQALALGLPCVAGCWIKHCVAKREILDWDQYLLAAGESSFLGGAVRNRNLQPYPVSTASFEERFNLRPKLLTGKAVLLITGKGKVEDLRKPYFFLTYVLGARSVKLVQNTQEARRVLVDSEQHSQQWDWVYVDKNEEDAERAIFGSSKAPTGKRKRGAIECDSHDPPKKVKIVGDEYVIQSLILGKFIEDD